MLVIARVALPVLVNVTDFDALVVPTFSPPNGRLVADSETVVVVAVPRQRHLLRRTGGVVRNGDGRRQRACRRRRKVPVDGATGTRRKARSAAIGKPERRVVVPVRRCS